ncbi:MAG: phospholipase D-like domain-containing protein [Myxococcaceae bacterium]
MTIKPLNVLKSVVRTVETDARKVENVAKDTASHADDLFESAKKTEQRVLGHEGAKPLPRELSLPKNYDGPIFVCDIDDTLRDTKLSALVEGKTQPPIAGAKDLLETVAARGIPIVYLSAGPEAIRSRNEAFLSQLPAGALVDRTSLSASALNPLNGAQAASQGDFKAKYLGQLEQQYPNAKLFGLGDDKYGDAQAYTRQHVTAYIHDVRPGNANIPADFHGTVTKSYTPSFIARVATDLDKAASKDPNPSLDALLDSLTGVKAVSGNSMKLLVNGDEAFPAVLHGIDTAKRTLYYETYNFLPGDPVADEVVDHLLQAKQRGVKVRVVLDAFGAREFPIVKNATVERLKKAGVDVSFYNPLDGLSDLNPNRDHRKLVVVDDQTAFMGGMNTGERYMGDSTVKNRYHDVFARVQGPAVKQLVSAFLDSREAAKDPSPLPSNETNIPTDAKAGSLKMRVLTHTPHSDARIRAAYLALIDSAKTQINVENSFPLSTDVVGALKAAAERGVRVNYIVGADTGGMKVLGEAARQRYQSLLDAGVHIYLYPTPVHTKAMSIDGQICTVGSSNFDEVALAKNREIISMIEDPAFTKHFDEEIFQKDLVGTDSGERTKELPKDLNDPLWRKLLDGALVAVWPKPLQ